VENSQGRTKPGTLLTFFQLLDVFTPPAIVGLVAAGIAVAILGAVLPARWAARTSTAEVLHAE
jgi:putative ABC transport system permease protein